MTQSSMPGLAGGTRGFFFVLQPNETGVTGSHQAGEVHVRKTQIGGFFPDMHGGPRETRDVPRMYFHAHRGEFGEITFTHYGGRSDPEDRLRKFPPTWRSAFIEGHVLIIVPAGNVGVVYFVGPTDEFPPGLEHVDALAKKSNFGSFPVMTAKKR